MGRIQNTIAIPIYRVLPYPVIYTGASVEVSNVWELSGEDRRRLVASSLRDRYERAMEDLKEKMKHYNTTRESYEVYCVYTCTHRLLTEACVSPS